MLHAERDKKGQGHTSITRAAVKILQTAQCTLAVQEQAVKTFRFVQKAARARHLWPRVWGTLSELQPSCDLTVSTPQQAIEEQVC